MARTIWVATLLVLILTTPAFGKDSIEPSTSRQFVGAPSPGSILDVDLVTECTNRVQIIITRQDEIIESHRLVTGPKGVIDGSQRGAVKWGYELPSNAQASEHEVFIMVLGLGGEGSPVSYDIAPKTADSAVGFTFEDE